MSKYSSNKTQKGNYHLTTKYCIKDDCGKNILNNSTTIPNILFELNNGLMGTLK